MNHLKKSRHGITKGFFLFICTLPVAFAKTETCTYELDPNTVSIGWTAFKTTKKMGVSGVFKKVNLQGKTKSHSFSELVQGLKVSVDASSLDTEDPGRNKTIFEFFFKKLSSSLSGTITDLSEKNQTFTLNLNLNGQSRKEPFHYKVTEEHHFQATGQIDILQFGAEKALHSLHEQCYDLHKGPDGISKTWPEVVLHLNGTIQRHCSQIQESTH